MIVTANTQEQLEKKIWRELAKWHKLVRNGHWFEWTATKFYLKSAPELWFASAVPWSKERSEAFAGTHEQHVLVVFDEASAFFPFRQLVWRLFRQPVLSASASPRATLDGCRTWRPSDRHR